MARACKQAAILCDAGRFQAGAGVVQQAFDRARIGRQPGEQRRQRADRGQQLRQRRKQRAGAIYYNLAELDWTLTLDSNENE
jgi:hypothetical protein